MKKLSSSKYLLIGAVGILAGGIAVADTHSCNRHSASIGDTQMRIHDGKSVADGNCSIVGAKAQQVVWVHNHVTYLACSAGTLIGTDKKVHSLTAHGAWDDDFIS